MAEPAFGMTLTKSGPVTIGKIKSISGGGQTITAIETSNMDADTVTNLPGLIRGKPITFEIEFEEATTGNYEAIQTASEGRAAETWTITHAGGTTVIGSGFVSDYSAPEGDTESEFTFSVEITPTTVWDMTGDDA